MIFDYLNREDLWERKVEDDINFEKEYFDLSKLKVSVGEGKSFYEFLGGDSQLLNFNLEEKKQISNDNINKYNNNIFMMDNEQKKDQKGVIEMENKIDNEDNELRGSFNIVNKKKRKLF